MVGAEGHRGHFKKARASWAGVPRKEISPGIQAGLARPLRERCAGETKLPAGPASQRHRKRAQASAWGKDSAPTSGSGQARRTGLTSGPGGALGERAEAASGWRVPCGPLGRAREKEGEVGLGRGSGPRGKGRGVWAGLGLDFLVSSFLFLFLLLFYFQPNKPR